MACPREAPPALRDGPDHIPAKGVAAHTRTCAGCRRRFDAAALLRFVKAPDGTIVFDAAHNLPGRGAWLYADPACFAKAAKTGGLAHTLKGGRFDAAARLLDARRALAARIVSYVQLARRAGEAVLTGRGVYEALRGEGPFPACIIVAEDASAGTWKKLAIMARLKGVPSYRLHTREEWGSFLAHGPLSAVAVRGSGLGAALLHVLETADRLAGGTAPTGDGDADVAADFIDEDAPTATQAGPQETDE